MTTKNQERLRLIRLYKEETGNQQVDMHEVAKFAVRMGWPLPIPVNPLDALAAQFAQSAREEIRHDKKTGMPYRANHALPVHGGKQLSYLWIDIDEAPRAPMLKSLVTRREQTIGDLAQLSFDCEHWNAMHPGEEPIVMPLDFTDDIEWRRNAPGGKSV